MIAQRGEGVRNVQRGIVPPCGWYFSPPSLLVGGCYTLLATFIPYTLPANHEPVRGLCVQDMYGQPAGGLIGGPVWFRYLDWRRTVSMLFTEKVLRFAYPGGDYGHFTEVGVASDPAKVLCYSGEPIGYPGEPSCQERFAVVAATAVLRLPAAAVVLDRPVGSVCSASPGANYRSHCV